MSKCPFLTMGELATAALAAVISIGGMVSMPQQAHAELIYDKNGNAYSTDKSCPWGSPDLPGVHMCALTRTTNNFSLTFSVSRTCCHSVFFNNGRGIAVFCTQGAQFAHYRTFLAGKRAFSVCAQSTAKVNSALRVSGTQLSSWVDFSGRCTAS